MMCTKNSPSKISSCFIDEDLDIEFIEAIEAMNLNKLIDKDDTYYVRSKDVESDDVYDFMMSNN